YSTERLRIPEDHDHRDDNEDEKASLLHVLRSPRRDRVVAARLPGMTARDPPDREQESRSRAVALDRLGGKHRARGSKPTREREERRQDEPIAPQGEKQHPGDPARACDVSRP